MSFIDQGALIALSVSLVWALTTIISAGPARKLGGMRYNRLRISMVAAGLAVIGGGIAWQQGAFPSLLQVLTHPTPSDTYGRYFYTPPGPTVPNTLPA